jgi:hypothetical protein
MLWQVENGVRYRLPGGYLITATGPRRVASFDGVPTVTEGLLEDAYKGYPLPVLTPDLLNQVRQNLAEWRIQTIVVVSTGRDPGEAVDLFEVALGTRPASVEGSAEWRAVQALLGHVEG